MVVRSECSGGVRTAFHMSVHRLSRPPPAAPPNGDDPSALDAWLAECRAGELYENPLGADGTVYRWWYLPARQLGLPLLGRLYHDGLEVYGGDLDRLGSELDALERRWQTSGWEQEPPVHWMAYSDDFGKTEGDVAFKDHLVKRAGYLRHAIDAACSNAGVVSVA